MTTALVILRRQDGAFVAAFSERKRGHKGGHRGGRQGGLREADEANADLFGSSSRRRPKEERLTLERPYSPECVEVEFSEVRPQK